MAAGMSAHTDEQIETAMTAALADRNLGAFVSLLHVYAVQAPTKAQTIYDAIMTGEITVKVPIR